MSDAQTRELERQCRAEGRPLPLRVLRREGRVSDALVRALAYCGDLEARELDPPGAPYTSWEGFDAWIRDEAWARGLDPILRACGREVFVRVLERLGGARWADVWFELRALMPASQWWEQINNPRPAVLAALREEVSRA